ncbi:hypothetical protein IWX90DRAFT_312996 [Phyllosticta citrichinensis]|uniref:Uncharacterized protein n=1 Tax=Phyllosticta citrichinensis TaxID=1130410 RepID=A0ABR1XM47_9PEZI
MKSSLPALFATLVPVALADVKFVSVNEGDVLTVGYGPKPITVEWVESGKSPRISDLETYELDLCAGPNDNFASIKTISREGRFSQGNTAEGVISPSDGGDTANAYFWRIVSTTKDGRTVTNYSPRFSLHGMSGKFPESIAESLKDSILDVASPGDLNHFELRQQVGGAAAAASDLADASYLLAYTLQTGLTRYAPMPKIPGSTITKSHTTMLYPTSAFTKFTTPGKSPDAQMTLTQSQTYSHTSIEATQSAAANPTDDMAKFLARWKD